jgi:hypothetical protein
MWGPEDEPLDREWFGDVWLNPPYSTAGLWAEKMANHGQGIMLVAARTDTAWFQEQVFGRAHALFFIRGRLGFYTPEGERITTSKGQISKAGFPSVFVAYGDRLAERLLMRACLKPELRGKFVRLVEGTRP